MTHDRVLLNVAMNTATEITAALKSHTEQVAYAGSLRRMRETIGDVDILATAATEDQASQIMNAFKALSGEVIVSGPTKTSIRRELRRDSSLQVDLRVVRPDAWGAALQYFTGSQAHNVAVRQIAIKQGLKLVRVRPLPRTTSSSPPRPKRTSIKHSACNGCRRRCARTPARSSCR